MGVRVREREGAAVDLLSHEPYTLSAGSCYQLCHTDNNPHLTTAALPVSVAHFLFHNTVKAAQTTIFTVDLAK